MDIYCLRCKKKVDIADATIRRTTKGMLLYLGKCPFCDSVVSRMGGKR